MFTRGLHTQEEEEETVNALMADANVATAAAATEPTAS
jgi:hypothetical protein